MTISYFDYFLDNLTFINVTYFILFISGITSINIAQTLKKDVWGIQRLLFGISVLITGASIILGNIVYLVYHLLGDILSSLSYVLYIIWNMIQVTNFLFVISYDPRVPDTTKMIFIITNIVLALMGITYFILETYL